MKSPMICTPPHILFCNQIKKNEMGGAYKTYGGDERQDFGGET